jgi:autotransporter-associated beta strand protein
MLLFGAFLSNSYKNPTVSITPLHPSIHNMKPKSSLRSFLALSGSAMLAVTSANATQFWDGTAGGGDNNWNTPANWGGDELPAFTTTAINFGSLSSAAGTAFGNVVVPTVTTTNNDLTAGTLIKTIFLGNNGQANRTDAYTLQGNSIVLGDVINNGIVTTALAGNAIVSSIEDVIELDMNLGTAGTHRQIQTQSKHDLRIDGVISGGVNVGLLLRSTDSKITVTNADNSYLGFTNIAEGTSSALGGLVEITSIADGGENSSIGASSNVAANLRFNSGFNDVSMTTLRYIGDTDASTDRLFTLYGNIAGTNSAIESSGDGTLSFTNTGAIASGHARGRNFYLGGTNTGDNTFAPMLGDFNATELSTFTKTGVGKWIITGNHGYTGATNVVEGTLILNGSTAAASAVSVASGATLGGNGIVNGTLNVTGSIAPGSDDLSTFAAGATTWNGASSASSATNWKFELGSGDTADLLEITGNFTKNDATGSVFNFDFLGSSFAGVFDLVNWTGSTTFDAGDFSYSNLGAGYTGTFEIVGGNTLQFTTVIPEPSTALAGLLLGLGLLRRRRTA